MTKLTYLTLRVHVFSPPNVCHGFFSCPDWMFWYDIISILETGNICKNHTLDLTCANGYLQMNIARWQTSDNCNGYVFSKSFNVIQHMKQLCNNRKTCTFTAKDETFQVSCSKHMETCSQFAYTYSCISKYCLLS